MRRSPVWVRSGAQLKGQCHEMNNLFEGLKIHICTSVYAPVVFNYFCILTVKKNTFKFLLASMKTLTNSGDFTGSCIRISNSGGTLKENWKPQFSL